MPSGKTRGKIDAVTRKSNGKSKVVHPRNPKLVKTKVEDDKQSPSAYMAEMQLTTEERFKLTYEMRVPQIIELLDMSEQTLQKFTSMNIDEPIFQPFPSDIVFQNFEPFNKYEVPLQLRNNDKIARLVKVTQTDSPYFKITSPLDVGHKVAPGMDTTFMIHFSPDEKKDYHHELICITEREKFLVPVRAIGSRAILDFPDEINFGTAPVKYATTKTLLIRNIGSKEARFQLFVDKPFSVMPDSGRLQIGESCQIHVEFNALHTGDHCSNMVLHYDTGEDIYIALYGAAVDYNIRLDKNTLKMENTYITSASQRIVTIANRSDIMVHFKWTKFATLREELQQKERFYMDLRRQEEKERDAFVDECLSDISIRDQMSIVTRKYKNKMQVVSEDNMLFVDDIVSIEPVEGEIWPNSQAEISIIFKPQETQSYARTLYCNVSGRESRLPLRVRGEGIGPLVQFSFDKLDIGSVFVNSGHSYEVILANKGDIDAVFSLIPSDTLFGPQFNFIPSQGIVLPGRYQAIKISFCSPVLGNFDEEFLFAIEGSPAKLKLCISGSVIGPTFHFDVPKLKFGTVSYGFVNSQDFKIKNTSLIPMTFHLRVPADGGNRVETNGLSDNLLDSNITNITTGTAKMQPKEFMITPCTGTIQPQDEMLIRIDFVSTTVKKYEMSLVADIEGVGEEVLSLSIHAKCVVPAITLHSPILNYGRCFLHHPYELPIQLVNDSDLPAKYELLAQIVDDQIPILYSSNEPKGIIEAKSIKQVPLQITAEFLEEVQTVAYIMIFGSNDQPLPVQVHCIGEGPVIHVMPTDIDYGTIPVLTEIKKTVKLSNESLIPAQFSCEMVRPQSLFSVYPSQGIIVPEDVLDLTVTARIDDTVKFQDKLSININDSKIQTVSLLAYGCGTTIVSDPVMAPSIKLGPQFSCLPCTRTFCLMNKGRRPQQIYWTTDGFNPFKTKKRNDYNPDDMKYQGVPPPAEPPQPIFSLSPDRMVLHPGESQEVTLTGFSNKAQFVKERMICHAIIGNSTGKEKIMKVDVMADFITPLLEFSDREVNFCVMKYPKSNLEVETKQVVMTNVSSLPLVVKLKTFMPFQLLVEDQRWASLNSQSSEKELCLAVSESIPVLIQFDPAYKEDSVTRVAENFIEVTFKDHPQMDFVKLKGEVFFPNLTFEMEEVDFGCILNDTEVTKVVSVTNHSPIDCKYHWCFIDSNVALEDKDEDEGIGDVGYGSQDEKSDENGSSNGSSRQSSRPVSAQQWAPASDPLFNIGIDEVFDILPLYSILHPMETQKLQFTFYGHANLSADAVARCSVTGGPDYDINLKGSASLVQYFFDKKTVNYQKQLFDQAASDSIVLHNTGKVGYDFIVLNMNTDDTIQPGLPNVCPSKGHIAAFDKQVITIKYLPGLPKKFEKHFQIRVAHFEPDKITLTGEGVFPRIMFDLPLDKSDERYAILLEQAKENLSKQDKTNDDVSSQVVAGAVGDFRLQMEIERLIVEQHAIEMTPSVSSLFQASKPKTKKTKAKPVSHLLDFGYVVYGTSRSHIIRVTNNGSIPASFAPDKSQLTGTGFEIELDRIKNLPGSPDNESIAFMVTFDPKGANVPLGVVDAVVPVTTLGGPLYRLRLKANVTMPDMSISTEELDFGNVVCGQCKVMTVQLHNAKPVRCDWSSQPTEEKKKRTDRMVPLHLRKKLRNEQPKPKHFELMPPVGTLQPGQRVNVQVKFMPTEEITYNQRVAIRIAQSTSRIVMNATGQGSEPKLEFSSTLVEFGPVLPHSNGDEQDVIVRNPCEFPIEIYSLEFDKQYLEEEKMLRNVKGYDECNTILLPPRQPGEKLPAEVVESYQQQQAKKEEDEKAQAETAAKRQAEEIGEGPGPDIATVPPTPGLPGDNVSEEGAADVASSLGVGELEITPVSAAIARYLGIDLSSEGKAARNRRGIALVVHGAPFSGKTPTSVALAKKYGAACLTVDGIITEALTTGSSSAARRAKDLCAAAARAAKEAEQATTESLQPSHPSSLSIEAVEKLGTLQPHNTSGSVTGAQSFMAREGRKTSTVGGPKGAAGRNVPQVQQGTPPETPPNAAPIARKLSVSASVCGEDGLYSCILPEDLLVELLSERMLLSDCQQGIVIDGLDSLFSPSIVATATAVLRALNNRKYMYFVTLMLTHSRLKTVEEKQREEKSKLDKLKEEEEKRRLEEMSEDEYDALTHEEKAEVDRKHLEQKKERLKREMERQEKEKKERELQLILEEKRLEEEKNSKRKRAGQQGGAGGAKKGHEAKEKKIEKSSEKLTPGRTTAVASQMQAETRGGAPSVVSERSDSSDVMDDKKRVSIVKGSKQHPRLSSAITHPQIEEPKQPTEEEEKEKDVAKKFTRFESSLRDIDNVLQHWDRSTGTINRPETPKSDNQEPEPLTAPGFSKKGKKDKEKEKEKEKNKEISVSPISGGSGGEHEEDDDGKKDGIGVPNIMVDVLEPQQSMAEKVLDKSILPTYDEVLDGLGLGPHGPPIPPPANFAVVPYPVRRRSPLGSDPPSHYIFVTTGPDDPNGPQEEKSKEPEQEPEKPVERTQEQSRKGGRRDDRESGAKSRRERQNSARKGKSGHGTASPPPGVTPTVPEEDKGEGVVTQTSPQLVTHRWIIQANQTVTLRIKFRSEELGQFDQTLNFEIAGTRRRYQLFCRGVCAFPAISREPRVVFPHRKKYRKPEEVVHRKYILSSETFEFGPLLCGKTRDRYKEERYPENVEKLTILNTSPLDSEISFCFQQDSTAVTFLLDPPVMNLKTGQSQDLSIWAYPKTPGFFEDALVCCIRENPEPVVFKLSCHGVRPELELDRKQLQFDRVLLHRKDTRTIFLRNSTLLPVAWRLNGLDNLGDDFSVTTEHGIIEAKSEYAMQMHFRAVRPTNVKKIVRLEVSDVEQIMGLVQAENIQVHAEAYDVALDMSFPKGTDGGLDFGILKVMDETKQACSLKNKGRFEINYNFVFETAETSLANAQELFTVMPNRGPLLPTDRPTQVQVIFRSKKEVTIKEQPILKCQIIEPHLGDAGEVIASIPVKISVRSVYSKYAISPVSDINFGAMLVNNKKVLVFAIENKGEFDFRYTVLKMINTVSQGRQKLGPAGKRSKSREGSSSGRSADNKPSKPKRADSVKGVDIATTAPNIRLQLGIFTLYPALGTVPAGSSVQVTVDMVAESPGFWEENISIDISDRPPTDHPQGIPYKLIGEACVPGISIISPTTIGSIFEEHMIVKQLNVFQYMTHDLSSGAGVYGEDENKFIFYNTIVGRKAKARFKISNSNKVPCDLVLSVKPISTKPSARWHDVYEVEPLRASISAHDYIYATVTFTPPSMQSYSAIFEAAVDGMPSVVSKYRNLTFDIQGEGNLPRISIKRPTSRNKKGNPVLLFRRLLLHRTQVLTLNLQNEGTLVSRVLLTLKDSDGVFGISCTDKDKYQLAQEQGDSKSSRGNRISVVVPMGESVEFRMEYTPSSAGRHVGEVKLSVVENPYEEGLIQLIGEGYEDDVSIDNIRSSGVLDTVPDNVEISDNTPALRENHVRFNDCAVGIPKQLSFTLTNHSANDIIRFSWTPPQEIVFSPCIGHLNPGCAKDITITFNSTKPKTFKTHNIPCKVSRIKVGENEDKVVDWDDRKRVVKWVDLAAEEVPGKPEDGSVPVSAQRSLKPAKKKVIEVELEPPYTALDDGRDLELFVSAICDYSKMKCKTENVHFKDTLMFQTRIYSFVVSNKGDVQFDYQWTFESTSQPRRVSVEEDHTPSEGHPTSRQHTTRPSTTLTASSSAAPSRAQAASKVSTDRPQSALALAYETASIVSDAATDIFPFTIEPECGSIPAGKKTNFVLKFAPMDIVDYSTLLTCRITNATPGKESTSIPVSGRGLLPYAHFELEDSDYITGGRRNPELRGANGAPPGSTLDPNTKVIEFKSCGVKVKNQTRFMVLNPTSSSYTFTWTNEDTLDGAPPDNCNFRCMVPSGSIDSGKKAEMYFEYVSDSLDLVESFWRFFIPEYNISVPFVLVGHTQEPSLSFDRSHINLREILVGHPVHQIVHLVNEEDVPFSFTFKEESLHTDGYASSLDVQPVSGSIGPKERLPIEISFVASAQKEVNFNALCYVKKKTSPLTLNVKAEGYAMNAQLFCEDSLGNKVELTRKGTNRINLGEVEINEKAIRSLFIFNSGKFNFDYTWELINKTKNKRSSEISISPESGTVLSNTRKRCQLVFCPLTRVSLKGCDLFLRVKNGPTFSINITGSGVQPSLNFSFLRHDFGPCFLYRAGMPLRRTTLVITNQDNKDISIECHYESTAYLQVHSQPGVLHPNKTMEVEFLFYPREAKHYHIVIPFEINGLSKLNVEIFGEGTDMKVEVVNPANKKVNLGALRIGQTSQKSIQLMNRSPATITFTVAVTPTTLQLQQDSSVLSVHPTREITLRANGGTGTVDVLFKPKVRVPQFSEEIMLECAGLSQPIFMIAGSCQGIEITLDNESLPFGAVMIGSKSTRQLIMHNTGDVGAAFAWNSEKFGPDFSVSPTKGYISPGMDVSFQIAFHPTTVNHDIRYEGLRCAIEGAKPLKLVLTGSCVPQTPLKEVLHFTTHVRTRETRNLVIYNRTNQLWMLRPVIEGEHWSGPDSITVEPQQSKNYELTYRPVVMTIEGKKHQGSVFFPLPDGSGLLYNITGTAEGPKPISNVQRDVPCKTPYTELLSVSNWLRRPQRFRVIIEMIKPEKPDNATSIKGLDYIDVPGLSKKDYKLNFFAHKEQTVSARVTFRNEQSNEYLFYYVTFKATAPGVMAAIELCTPVRKSTSHVVTLHNPLGAPVSFNSQCSVADIQLPPNFTIPAMSEGSCMFEYLPLKAGDAIPGKLSFHSSELGVYQYDLVLTATPAGQEAPVHFRASLGTTQVHTCRFVSFAKSKVEYSCKVDNSDFHVEKTITAASASSGGTEVGVDVTYEPIRLGDTRATLTIFSTVGGEYIFPLFGHCSVPKPQGPYTIKSGATASIPFKNVFPSTTQFQFFVDNPCFNVKASETIRAKKTHNIIVGYEVGQTASKAPRTGKLLISCPKSAGGAGNITWTFYLKGNVH